MKKELDELLERTIDETVSAVTEQPAAGRDLQVDTSSEEPVDEQFEPIASCRTEHIRAPRDQPADTTSTSSSRVLYDGWDDVDETEDIPELGQEDMDEDDDDLDW